MRKSILLSLNEINFDFIEKYIELGYLPTFKKVINQHGYDLTRSEEKYELLEPWIQWVTVHTGKTYREHEVFRLGDIAERTDLKQLWEIAEENGLSVGAVSPFNAKNCTRNSKFFIPDPWTKTHTTGSKTVKALSKAVSAAVNDNASNKVDFKSMRALIGGFLKLVPLSRVGHYVKLASRFRRKATKAAILDNILADIFISLWKDSKPDFSSLFLNAGAHEQHHYMFNSKVYSGDQRNPGWYIKQNDDPVLDILIEYDNILKRILELDCRVFIATGLHQKPHVHNTYYWRLTNHENFLHQIDVKFKNVLPRMSRDFLIEFADEQSCRAAENKLGDVSYKNERVFSIDNRGTTLFVELVYSNDIKEGSFCAIKGQPTILDLFHYVSFVAIKNGEHDGMGYFIDTDNVAKKSTIELKEVFNVIVNSFLVKRKVKEYV